jgi:hypothetical protein
MNRYRFYTHVAIGFDIMAESEDQAVVLANKWRNEMADINNVENLIIDEEEIIGKSVAAFSAAVYVENELTADDIEDIEEAVGSEESCINLFT